MKYMKNLIGAVVLCLVLGACNNGGRKAEGLLSLAREAYADGRYTEAKLLIDSAKTTYPKAYDARREGLALKREVELAEATRTLTYLDSLYAAQQLRLDSLRPSFVFEQDTAYESVGHYLYPSQVIERNLHRSYLRFRTDANGRLTMTATYCGSYNIHHNSVRITAPDGSFASTPIARDCYETEILGERLEKSEFALGQDGGVMAFIRLNNDKNLRLTFSGEKTFHTNLLPDDRKALVAVYALAEHLTAMAQTREGIDEAQRRIDFYKKAIDRAQSEADAD